MHKVVDWRFTHGGWAGLLAIMVCRDDSRLFRGFVWDVQKQEYLEDLNNYFVGFIALTWSTEMIYLCPFWWSYPLSFVSNRSNGLQGAWAVCCLVCPLWLCMLPKNPKHREPIASVIDFFEVDQLFDVHANHVSGFTMSSVLVCKSPWNVPAVSCLVCPWPTRNAQRNL